MPKLFFFESWTTWSHWSTICASFMTFSVSRAQDTTDLKVERPLSVVQAEGLNSIPMTQTGRTGVGFLGFMIGISEKFGLGSQA